jgi:hypothetical protein
MRSLQTSEFYDNHTLSWQSIALPFQELLLPTNYDGFFVQCGCCRSLNIYSVSHHGCGHGVHQGSSFWEWTPCLQAFVPSETWIKSLSSAKFGRKNMVPRFWYDVASTLYHKANPHVHLFFLFHEIALHWIVLHPTKNIVSFPFSHCSSRNWQFLLLSRILRHFLHIHASM